MPLSTFVVLPLLMMTVGLSSLLKQTKFQLTVIFLMVVLIVMQLISIYFSGGFIDYQFFVNLNINDIIDGLFIFKLQALLTIIVFLSLLFLLYKLCHLFKRKLSVPMRLLLVCLSAAAISYSNGPVSKLYEIYQITSAPRLTFNQALAGLNMQNIADKAQLKSEAGKNIIVISLESFEQNFLNQTELTPHLKKLTQQYTFFDKMPMSAGSSWTTASMYTYMTGMPFLVAGLTVPPLSNAKQTRLVSLGDILQQAGYQTRYIIGNPTFASIGHIINLFGINIISEKSYQGEYPTAPFGLYDKDTFAIAKRQLDELSKQKQPFALFISTISTHAPNGFYDPRMESVISPKQDNISFVAASLDYNLGQFMGQLKQQGQLDNTVFYIFPDHLMMGAGTSMINRLSQQERLLYLLTNAAPHDLGKNTDQQIYQIDLPRLILNGAHINTNAQFLTDVLANSHVDTQTFIEQNKSKIASLNLSALMAR